MSRIPSLFLELALAVATAAQSTNSSNVAGGQQCNTSLSSANASGVFDFAVNYPLPPDAKTGQSTRDVPDPSWAVTVHGGNGKSVQRRLWYNTAGQNYSDDLSINYDVCAFVFSSLPTNTLRLGQEDSGNCSTMLTERCIDSLKSAASHSAHQWVMYSSPPPYENLTAGVLPSICGYVYRDLDKAAKEECQHELEIHDDVDANQAVINNQALTGYNNSVLYNQACASGPDNQTFHHVPVPINRANSDWRTGTDAGYDNATHDVLPILTVHMPVANVKRTSVYSVAPSSLQCVRVKDFSEGSRVSPDLPKGTPWPSSAGVLSTKAKAGIIAGVVVFVLLVGSLVFGLWYLRRKKRHARILATGPATDASDANEKSLPEADGSHGVNELHSSDRKAEVDSTSVVEMEDGRNKPLELASTAAPVELPVESNGR